MRRGTAGAAKPFREAATKTTVSIRPLRISDVEAAVALINDYAAEDRMLERTPEFVRERLGDFLVADDGGFQGCVALASLTGELAEIRSLAVRPEASGRGVGRALVQAALEEARRRGLRRVFALTLVPEFFERCGFTLVSLGRLPEKSTAECPICPKRGRCDEQAMLMHLDGTTPRRLQPHEPVGYTRLMELTPTRSP